MKIFCMRVKSESKLFRRERERIALKEIKEAFIRLINDKKAFLLPSICDTYTHTRIGSVLNIYVGKFTSFMGVDSEF